MATCKKCGNKTAFLKELCDECLEITMIEDPEKAKLAAKVKEKELLELKNKIQNIIISTGDLKRDYDIIDVVFAIDSVDEGFLGALMQKTIQFSFGADPSKAFSKVKDQLRYQCINLGGNAIINCQFEHHAAASRGIGGSGIGVTQSIEIFAYGTAVKFKI